VYNWKAINNYIMNIQEEWRDVKDYEGYYQISNLGRVKSLDRYIKHRGGNTFIKEKILKSILKINNYSECFLYKYNKKTYRVRIHRLVAQQFLDLDISDSKMCVCHKDDNRSNNHVDNLFLGTAKDNVRDCMKKNRRYHFIGEKNGCSKLTEKQVLKIRELCKNTNLTHKEISKQFNVSESRISIIKNRKSWKHI